MDTKAVTSDSSAGTDQVIKAERLCKSFGPISAVDCISFTVPRGQILGLLGQIGRAHV